MKTKEVKEILEKYRVPKIPVHSIDDTVRLAKKKLNQQNVSVKIPFRNQLIGQIKYISPYVWTFQGILLIIISSFLLLAHDNPNAMHALSVILSTSAPIIALVAIPELAKSFYHNVWEMETACRFSFQKLMTIRLIIMGGIDLIVITFIIIITNSMYDTGLINIILYIIVPFNLANSVYLFILSKLRGKTAIFGCLTTGAFITIGIAMLSVNSQFYLSTSMFVWMIMLILSTFIMIYEFFIMVKSYQKGEKLIWNLR